MGIINRGLLFLYTLFFGVVSLGVVGLCLHVIPERVLLNEYEYLMSQWQTGAVAGVIFLISLHLLLCCFAGKKTKDVKAKEILVVKGASGPVNVSLAAIREMAEVSASNVNGVRQAQVKSRVERREDGDFLKLDINLEVGQERNVAEISDEIRQNVSQYVTEVAGIGDVEINVAVQNITSGVSVKKRRVK